MKTQTLCSPTKPRPLRWRSALCTCLSPVLVAGLCTTGQIVWAQLPDVTADYAIQVVAPPSNTPIVGFLWMNNSGMTSMEYLNSEWQLQAAILQAGVWMSIDVPHSVQTGTSGPNSSGRMALMYADSSGNWRNAVYHNGTYTYLPNDYGPPGQPAYSFTLMLINDSGIMTGVAYDTNGVNHGLVLNESLSLFRVFDYPGAASTNPYGINNAGDIVGMYTLPDGTQHCFLCKRGSTFMNVDPPGAATSGWPAAVMINNKGEICGSYIDSATGVSQGFLLQDGVFSLFKVAGASASGLNCITDGGDLAGSYVDVAGNQFGFIARRIGGRQPNLDNLAGALGP